MNNEGQDVNKKPWSRENIASIAERRQLRQQVLYKVQPVLSTLENVYKEMEIKYRSVKKQQETITDRLIETGSTEEQLKANQQVGDKVRAIF